MGSTRVVAGSVFGLWLVAFSPTSARGQTPVATCAMVLAARSTEVAERAVADVLRRHDFVVLPSGDVALRLVGSNNLECRETTCLPALVSELGVTAAVLVEARSERRRSEVTVTLVAASDGLVAEGHSESDALDGESSARMNAVATQAAMMALARWDELQRGTLHIETTPPGASVLVGGEHQVSETPIDLELASGRYRVGVSLEGYGPQERDVDVLRGDRVTLSFDMTPLLRPPASSLSWLNFVLGGALVATGALLWISPVMTLARSGQCDASDAFGCQRYVSFEDSMLGSSIAGTALIGGGLVLIVAQPID